VFIKTISRLAGRQFERDRSGSPDRSGDTAHHKPSTSGVLSQLLSLNSLGAKLMPHQGHNSQDTQRKPVTTIPLDRSLVLPNCIFPLLGIPRPNFALPLRNKMKGKGDSTDGLASRTGCPYYSVQSFSSFVVVLRSRFRNMVGNVVIPTVGRTAKRASPLLIFDLAPTGSFLHVLCGLLCNFFLHGVQQRILRPPNAKRRTSLPLRDALSAFILAADQQSDISARKQMIELL
jgi:hypothetical protein